MVDAKDALIAELQALVAEQAALIAQQDAVIAQLQAQVAELRARWVQRAVEGAVAETRAHHRSVLTGRCIP